MNDARYSTVDLARLTGCGRKAIRLIQDRGLIPRPVRARAPSYDDATLRRVRAIVTLQAAGLSLDDVALILAVRERGQGPGATAELTFEQVNDAALRLSERIELLTRLRRDLVRARESLARCRGCENPESACQKCVESGELCAIGRVILTES